MADSSKRKMGRNSVAVKALKRDKPPSLSWSCGRVLNTKCEKMWR